MSLLTNLIFNNEKHYITSKFGYRKSFNTKGGATSSFHNGTDYGTNGQKIPQYAVENGTILSCGTDKLGGKYVWVKYPRLNVKMLHYHLSSVNCKTGQSVSRGTLLGYTGMTGKATGIHLHLSIYDLSKGCYVNPEGFNYTEPNTSSSTNFLGERGYFKLGDKHPNVGKIASFMRKTFPSYTKKAALGNLYGPNLIASIKEFQRRTGLVADGCTGPKTLAKLVEYGFRY